MAYEATKSSSSAGGSFKDSFKITIFGINLKKLLQTKIFLWLKIFYWGLISFSFGMLGLNVDGVEQSLAYWALPWRARQRFTAPMEISSKPKSRVRGGSIIDLV
tara:strand:+ start:116 stop:427 length:312 start_codon:yes stop_codon:yes gene_type:complete